MDETGIAMGVIGCSLIVVPHGTADQYLQQPGNQNWVSILETINGINKAFPPFLIFKGQHHQYQWYPQDAPVEWQFAVSENGWTNKELALGWLKEHFEPMARPVPSDAY